VGRRSKRSFKPSPTTPWVAAGCLRCDGSTPMVCASRTESSARRRRSAERSEPVAASPPQGAEDGDLDPARAIFSSADGVPGDGRRRRLRFPARQAVAPNRQAARSMRSPPESSPQDVQRSADLSMNSPQAGAPQLSRYSGGSNHRSPPSALLCLPHAGSALDRRQATLGKISKYIHSESAGSTIVATSPS
jgi:hypothetical protein